MRALLTLAFVLTVFVPNAVSAQDYNTLLDIPAGMTLLNVSATERVEVEQDLLSANMRYETEDRDPGVVQNEINTLMKKAVDEAQKTESVKAVTQSYSVHQYNRSRDRTRPDMVWKGQQGLMIKGKNPEALLKLVGKLQEMGLAMNGLSYSISPELLEETRNSMLEDALAKLQIKAKRTAKAIGKSDAELLQVNVDNGGFQPQPRHHVMSAMADGMAERSMAAPVATPGESQITLSVSAQALLK